MKNAVEGSTNKKTTKTERNSAPSVTIEDPLIKRPLMAILGDSPTAKRVSPRENRRSLDMLPEYRKVAISEATIASMRAKYSELIRNKNIPISDLDMKKVAMTTTIQK
jgi:hypothetical protein